MGVKYMPVLLGVGAAAAYMWFAQITAK